MTRTQDRRLAGLRSGATDLLRSAVKTSWDLFKVMIPVILLTKALQELGAVEILAWALEPVMGLVGLPGEMGLVWATAMLVNLYGGMAAFVSLADEMAPPLTAAQVTVLTTMMLVAHGLLIECRICQKAGPRFRAMAALRVAAALVIGGALHLVYRWGGFLGQPSQRLWEPGEKDAWLVAQAKNLLWIFVIILVLLFVLRVLKTLGVTGWLTRVLEPGLRALGMPASASAWMTGVGLVVGVLASYPAGWLVDRLGS